MSVGLSLMRVGKADNELCDDEHTASEYKGREVHKVQKGGEWVSRVTVVVEE